MSGTSSSFASSYGPLASQAGATLGIDQSLILSQWALESGYGTNSLTANGNNPGSIMTNGTGNAYASPSQFEQAYVNTIQQDFPQAVGTGSNPLAFAQGLANGINGSYYGTENPAQYAAGILGAQSNLNGTTPGSAPITPTGGTTTAATSGCSANLSSIFTFTCWKGLLLDAVFIAVGAGMIFIAVAGGSKTPSVIINAAKVS